MKYLIENNAMKFEYISVNQLAVFIKKELIENTSMISAEMMKEEYFYQELTDMIETLKNNHTLFTELTYGIKGEKYIEEIYKDIVRKGRKQANKYAKVNFETYYKFHCLEMLDLIIKDKDTTKPTTMKSNIKIECNETKNTSKNRLKKRINEIESETRNIKYINERTLEDFLASNLDYIESGLKYVGRQIVLPEGRIDILAKDSEEKMVIIELKTEEDKDILWQSVYYPKEIGKKYGEENVRMIVLSPIYSETIRDVLSNISKAELYTYIPTIKNRKIASINIRKN